MFLPASLFFALAGVGLAGAAALLADTGIDGTPGAFLAFLGAAGASLALGLLVSDALPARTRSMFKVLAGFALLLTALAAFFLMQMVLLPVMVVSFVALLASAATAQQRTLP